MHSSARNMLSPCSFSLPQLWTQFVIVCVFWGLISSPVVVVTTVLLDLPILSHHTRFDPVCSPRVRLSSLRGMIYVAMLTAQQCRGMATLGPRYSPLSCSGLDQRWILDLPYISLHSHPVTSALTCLRHSTGITKVILSTST